MIALIWFIKNIVGQGEWSMYLVPNKIRKINLLILFLTHWHVTFWLSNTVLNYLYVFCYFLLFVFLPCWLVGFWIFKWRKTDKNITMVLHSWTLTASDSSVKVQSLASSWQTVNKIHWKAILIPMNMLTPSCGQRIIIGNVQNHMNLKNLWLFIIWQTPRKISDLDKNIRGERQTMKASRPF
jgi:hypothetical protein